MQRFYWSEDQNDGNAIERCAPSGPQNNHSNLLIMSHLNSLNFIQGLQ